MFLIPKNNFCSLNVKQIQSFWHMDISLLFPAAQINEKYMHAASDLLFMCAHVRSCSRSSAKASPEQQVLLPRGILHNLQILSPWAGL